MVTGNGACATCHLGDYNATTVPAHATVGFPTTCGDCHLTTTWTVKQHEPAATEAAFPISNGVHNGIACMDCHDTTLSSDFKSNQNCTKTCHTAANTNGFKDSSVPEAANVHNGATWNSSSPTFCRSCHPTGGDATSAAMSHTTASFDQGHGNANGCTSCHLPTLDPAPVNPAEAGQHEFSQDATCSNGSCHKPSSVDGFRTSAVVDASMDGLVLPQATITVTSPAFSNVTYPVTLYVTTTPDASSTSGIQQIVCSGFSGATLTGCTGGLSTLHTGDPISASHHQATAWGYQGANAPPARNDGLFCIRCHANGNGG